MLKVVVVALAAFLVGCNSDSSDSNDLSGSTNSPEILESRAISTIDGEITVSYQNKANLNLSGVRNTVTIASNLKEFNISGTENQVTVNDGVEIETINLSGVSNSLSLPNGYVVTIKNSGIDNRITYR